MLSRLVLTLAMLLPTSAWANDATPEPTPEPTPSSSLEWDQSPIPGSENWGQPERTLETVFNISGGSYTPPPEASQGVGGWAIVHPGTGVVHVVIVATIETYYANNGRMQIEYMGCPAGCLLRFQTIATSDGNVAGWHGPDVTYDNSDQTFTHKYSINCPDDIPGCTEFNANGSTQITNKITPSRTSSNGVNIETGLVTQSVFTSSQVNGLAVKLTRIQDFFNRTDLSKVEYQDWESFSYQTTSEMLDNLSSDVEASLILEGYETEEPQEDGFVDTIKKLTDRVFKFFGGSRS